MKIDAAAAIKVALQYQIVCLKVEHFLGYLIL